jgi:hypothetical protein
MGIVLLPILGGHLALFAQSELPISSLCSIEKSATEGSHNTVCVSGLYGPSLDQSVLEDSSCPAESSWVELALRSGHNKKKLRNLLDRSRQA